MARILFLLFVLVIVNGHRHHLKFPKPSEESEQPYKIVMCDSLHDKMRDEVIEESKCGKPRDYFKELKIPGSYLKVTPSWAWVKRCVGLCPDGQCVATSKKTRSIPIRIYNIKTRKETCATYDVEDHETCGCCTQNCPSPKVFNPRKCSCQCPNMEERRNCLKKSNLNMRWKRSKCSCEPKRKTV